MSPEGIFITFEGGDGAGKSSALDFVYHNLLELGYPVIKTREPGGTPLGDHVRKLLLEASQGVSCGGRAELMLFLASRAQHVDEFILPSLKAGKIVLCDRFNDSSIAYQGFARNFGVAEVEKMCEFASMGLKPHLTLLLDIEPQAGLERVKKLVNTGAPKGPVDRIESEAMPFHEEVRLGYLLQAERNPERIVCIDAGQSKEHVCQQALSIVLKSLQKNR